MTDLGIGPKIKKKKKKRVSKNLIPFRKGITTNPTGRPITPIELKTIRDTCKNEVEFALYRIGSLSYKDLKEQYENQKGTAIELAIMALYATAAKTGCHKKLEFIFDRTIGKVKEEVEHQLGESFADLMEKAKRG